MKLLSTLAALVGLASLAPAQSITLIHEGQGSGDLNGVPFAATSIVITAEGDISQRISFSAGWFLEHTNATVEIGGIGTYQFTSPTRTFVNNSGQIVGFSRGTAAGSSDLMNGPSDAAFASWDMTTAVGPVSGFGNFLQWTSGDVTTTGGVLNMDGLSTPITFTASLCSGSGSAYCFGDGSGALCPCAGFGGPGEGCANTSGAGAVLAAAGDACSQGDTLRFQVTGVPGSKPGLLIRGSNQIANPAGDGILCTAGQSQRSQVQITSAGSTIFNDFNGQPFGAVANLGAPTNFQFWYRDPQNTCSGSGFNFSNAWTVTYQP
jgi:hypothetical protein